MRIYNVDKNKVLEDLANDCVYAKETEFPYSKDTYFNLGEIGETLKERCIAKIKDENGEETYQDYSGSLSKLFDIKVGSFNPKIDKNDYEEFSKSEVTLLVLDKEDDEKEKNLTLNISKVSEDGERNLYQLNTDKDNRNKVLAVLTNDKALEIIGKTFDGKKEIEFISKENLEKENNNLIEKISTEYQDIRVKDIDDFDRNVMRKTVAKVGLTLRENEMKNQSSNLFKIIEDEHKDTFKKEIDNLEDKAKFLEKNADKLGLSLNVYGKVKEIYSEDENEYKANVEAVLKTLEEGSLNNFFENLENQKEKMEKYSHSEVPIENVIHKMSYDMKGDIRQDIAKSLDFDSIVRNTATLVMIEENFTVEDAKNIKNMSDEEKSQFVDKINDYISERGSHIKEVKVSDLEKLEKVNFDKVSDLRENSYKEEQRKEKENQKERAYQRDERTDREYDF